MAQISIHATEKSPGMESKAEKVARLFFIDNLRTALVILVVLHHIALVYGASLEGYYYVEPPFNEPLTFLTLLVFALFNQAWFMGAFFLLAGYFTPGSFERKGPSSFLKARLLRLGIPLVIFFFVLNPISFIGYYLMPASLTGITTPLTWPIFWQAYSHFIGLGPLWFVAMLLIFSFSYAAWRLLTRNRVLASMNRLSLPSYLDIGIFVLALAVVSYLLRIVMPIGKTVLHFPSLAYLPQYLSFYVLGAIASRQDWLRTMPRSLGFVGFVAALAATTFLFPLAFSGQLFSLELTEALDNAMGNGHWQSAVYTLWDSIFAVGMFLALMTFFRGFINGRGGFGCFLSRHSYTVYIIHIPIVVFLAYALREFEFGSLLRFGLASLVIVPACFAVAYIIRTIPGVSRIL